MKRRTLRKGASPKGATSQVCLAIVVISLSPCALAPRLAEAERDATDAKTTDAKTTDPKASSNPTAIPSASTIDLQAGDYIHLQEPATFKRVDLAKKGQSGTDVCFKPHSAFRFVRALIDGGGDPSQIVLEFRREKRMWQKSDQPLQDCAGNAIGPLGDDGKTTAENIKYGTAVYRINRDELPPEYYKHFGVTHGPLFVPFKRRPDKSLSGESSLGYYIGYRADIGLAFALTPIVTAGMSLVNVTNDSAITPTSTAQDSGVRPAFTYGAGLILTHRGQFQIGAIYARDRIGGDAGKQWKFEGKGWYSLAIGYSFTR